MRLAQGHQPEGRRRRHPAGRVLARRLPAHGRDRALLADHAAVDGVRRQPAARCSASATASRCCSRPGLLPGAMLRNRDLKFHCEHVYVAWSRPTRRSRARAAPARCCGCRSRTARATTSPPPDVIDALEASAGSSSATATPTARSTDAANPNGSVNNIAGICNEARNVVGLMPHPERACEAALGSADGLVLFESVVACAGAARAVARSIADDRSVLAASRPRSRDEVRAHRPRRWGASRRDRARHLLGDVVRALQLQELAHPPEEAADRGAAGPAGPRRERRRGRHRRRAGRGLQDRIAQPPVVHRALSGRRDRRRRDHPRHLHDGRAARSRCSTRCASARSTAPWRPHPADHGGRGRAASPATATASAFPPSAARSRSTTRTPATRSSTSSASASSQADALVKGKASGAGNPVYYVGAKTGRDGIHGATMASAEFDDKSAEKRPAVQVGDPVHGEAAARGVPRADGDRRARSASRTWAPPA